MDAEKLAALKQVIARAEAINSALTNAERDVALLGSDSMFEPGVYTGGMWHQLTTLLRDDELRELLVGWINKKAAQLREEYAAL